LNPVIENRAQAHQALMADLSTTVGRPRDRYINDLYLADAGKEIAATSLSTVIEDSGLLRAR
jgi:hypothetical protein